MGILSRNRRPDRQRLLWFLLVIKFSFMFIYKMFKYMALGTAYVVKRILDLPHGWAILAGVVIILALIQAFSS